MAVPKAIRVSGLLGMEVSGSCRSRQWAGVAGIGPAAGHRWSDLRGDNHSLDELHRLPRVLSEAVERDMMGTYHLAQELCNGRPVWREFSGAEMYIFSDAGGVWHIDESYKEPKGLLKAAAPGGSHPLEVEAGGGGWVEKCGINWVPAPALVLQEVPYVLNADVPKAIQISGLAGMDGAEAMGTFHKQPRLWRKFPQWKEASGLDLYIYRHNDAWLVSDVRDGKGFVSAVPLGGRTPLEVVAWKVLDDTDSWRLAPLAVVKEVALVDAKLPDVIRITGLEGQNGAEAMGTYHKMDRPRNAMPAWQEASGLQKYIYRAPRPKASWVVATGWTVDSRILEASAPGGRSPLEAPGPWWQRTSKGPKKWEPAPTAELSDAALPEVRSDEGPALASEQASKPASGSSEALAPRDPAVELPPAQQPGGGRPAAVGTDAAQSSGVTSGEGRATSGGGGEGDEVGPAGDEGDQGDEGGEEEAGGAAASSSAAGTRPPKRPRPPDGDDDDLAEAPAKSRVRLSVDPQWDDVTRYKHTVRSSGTDRKVAVRELASLVEGCLTDWLAGMATGDFTASFISRVKTKTMYFSWDEEDGETEHSQIAFDRSSGKMVVCKLEKQEATRRVGLWPFFSKTEHTVSMSLTFSKMRAVNAAAHAECSVLVGLAGAALMRKLKDLNLFERT